jgi:molecular chaperone GrpE
MSTENASESVASSAESPAAGVPDAPDAPEGLDAPEERADAEVMVETPDPLVLATESAAKYKDQWMRTAADFDNFRKRARRDVEDARKAGATESLRELLPVFDNLERALQSSQQATDIKPVAEGLDMVLRQFTDALGRIGIQRIATVGQPFNPLVHEAIQQLETDEHPAGTVVAEVHPGYLQGERLVRAAMVVVAKPPAS